MPPPPLPTTFILYTSEDGRSRVQLRSDQGTVWLTQLEMAELFNATKQNISLHLKNIFEEGELQEVSVVKDSLTTATDGKAYRTKLYNLDGRPDHFDEMLARIRDIRASEKRFYQKLRDLFKLAADYDPTDQATQLETAELRAKRQTITHMDFWCENVGQIILANGFPLLSGAGTVRHAHMEQQVAEWYLGYDQQRKSQEAQVADAQDDAELKALEGKLKHRKGAAK